MRERIFRDLMILIGLTAGFEVIFLTMENDRSCFSQTAAETSHLISLICHNLIPFYLAQYVLHLLCMNYGFKFRIRILFGIPMFLTLVLLLLPSTRHMIFMIGPDASYTTGSLYTWLFVQTFFYLIATAIFIIRSRRSFGRRNFVIGTSLISLGILSAAASGISPYLKATNFLQMIILLCVVMTIESSSDNIEPVTGLRSREAFESDVQITFGTAYNSYVLTLKIYNFANHRSIFGGKNSIALLQAITKWMLSEDAYNRSFYYIGQGIFSIILYNSSEAEAAQLSDKILNRFSRKWQMETQSITLPVQIWRCDIPSKVDTLESLLLTINTPYNPKYGAGKVISSDHIQEQKRSIELEAAVDRAIRENSFEVFYQPIYSTKQQKFHCAEALIRLNDPVLGYIPPDEFIEVAERNGMIGKIGEIVFESVCRFLSEQKPERFGIHFIEVNLSTIQSLDESLPEKLINISNRYSIDRAKICLEITETGMIYNQDAMLQTVERLREAGFSFALDDFGTGYSNFTYILSFPVSIVKIDKSILWAADNDSKKEQILQHIIKICHDLNYKIVVEGVESQKHISKLKALRAEYLQGFCFSRALPEKQFIEYVKEMNTAVPNHLSPKVCGLTEFHEYRRRR